VQKNQLDKPKNEFLWLWPWLRSGYGYDVRGDSPHAKNQQPCPTGQQQQHSVYMTDRFSPRKEREGH